MLDMPVTNLKKGIPLVLNHDGEDLSMLGRQNLVIAVDPGSQILLSVQPEITF